MKMLFQPLMVLAVFLAATSAPALASCVTVKVENLKASSTRPGGDADAVLTLQPQKITRHCTDAWGKAPAPKTEMVVALFSRVPLVKAEVRAFYSDRSGKPEQRYWNETENFRSPSECGRPNPYAVLFLINEGEQKHIEDGGSLRLRIQVERAVKDFSGDSADPEEEFLLER